MANGRSNNQRGWRQFGPVALVLAACLSGLAFGAEAPSSAQVKTARVDVAVLQAQLTPPKPRPAPLVPTNPATSLNVPILLYHQTPADFDAIITHLQAKGYAAIDLDQLAAALAGRGGLPPKPVVITFDDGLANQWYAYQLLTKHRMKAVFYIINGGPASNWCIGAGRRNFSCGDGYLSWSQIRQIDAGGLITIGCHTADHANLPALPADQQRAEIAGAKAELEKQLGHPVYHFAYPYGAFNALTVQLAREAGFVTAVTTTPGTNQTAGGILTLRRVRDAYALP